VIIEIICKERGYKNRDEKIISTELPNYNEMLKKKPFLLSIYTLMKKLGMFSKEVGILTLEIKKKNGLGSM